MSRFEDLLREAAEIHCAGIQDPDEVRSQSVAILEFLAANGQSDVWRKFLAAELERLRELGVDGFDAEFQKPWTQPASTGAGNDLYHELAYPSYLHPRMHPDQLAMMSHVFGLDPAPPEHCRVLELGCGTGHSLLAFALDLRESEFVGVDFSASMIAKAQATAGRLGLQNVRFVAADAMDVDQSYGKFDYIVAHGFYSWVPGAVRERLFAICRDLLTPNGLLYVSFNATPGYQLPAILRDQGLASGAVTGVESSRAAMQRVLATPLDELPDHRRMLVQPCLENFAKSNPLQVLYDEFGEINVPFRFSKVCAAASEYGLRYVTEAGIEDWSATTLSAQARQLLVDLGDDSVRRMQYRDLLRLTRFHASLFCRGERQPALAPIPECAAAMFVTSRAAPHSANPDVRSDAKEVFESPSGVVVNIGEPLLKSALVLLYLERPMRFRLEDLVAEACQLAGIPLGGAVERFKQWLMPFWETGMIDLHWHMPELSPDAGDYPLASPYALECATDGSLTLPSLLGSAALLDQEQDRLLLLQLDGSRDEAALMEATGLAADDLRARLANFARLGLLLA